MVKFLEAVIHVLDKRFIVKMTDVLRTETRLKYSNYRSVQSGTDMYHSMTVCTTVQYDTDSLYCALYHEYVTCTNRQIFININSLIILNKCFSQLFLHNSIQSFLPVCKRNLESPAANSLSVAHTRKLSIKMKMGFFARWYVTKRTEFTN